MAHVPQTSKPKVIEAPKPLPSSSDTIKRLREERMKREMEERKRTEDLLRQRQGLPPKSTESAAFSSGNRYHSQFHPEFARQRPY
jgi:hypothetical protein